MIEHDMHIGQFLDLLDELGIADNTIVFYSTDNGPHMNTWPDAAMTPFRGEKNTNWEGGWRVPAMVRWPGVIEPGSVSNEIMHHMDWLPTFLAAAGRRTSRKSCWRASPSRRHRARVRVHLDGYNFLPYLLRRGPTTGRAQEIFYFSDDGDLTALRYNDWKAIFLEHRYPQTLRAWAEPWTPLRIPLLFNLRRDPYERARSRRTPITTGISTGPSCCCRRPICRAVPATFQEFPPRQEPGSFTIGDAAEMIRGWRVRRPLIRPWPCARPGHRRGATRFQETPAMRSALFVIAASARRSPPSRRTLCPPGTRATPRRPSSTSSRRPPTRLRRLHPRARARRDVRQ
jgi:hypothetical protein